jgi:hypothetical protein
MEGIELINAFTTTRMPSNLDRAFSGRNALNVRIVLNIGISASPT